MPASSTPARTCRCLRRHTGGPRPRCRRASVLRRRGRRTGAAANGTRPGRHVCRSAHPGGAGPRLCVRRSVPVSVGNRRVRLCRAGGARVRSAGSGGARQRICLEHGGLPLGSRPARRRPEPWAAAIADFAAAPHRRRADGVAGRAYVEARVPSWGEVLEHDLLPVWRAAARMREPARR